LTADRPLTVTLVSCVAHELCHANQAEQHGTPTFMFCYHDALKRHGYRENRFELEARQMAHIVTSWLLERTSIETDQQLAELCGLKWRTA